MILSENRYPLFGIMRYPETLPAPDKASKFGNNVTARAGYICRTHQT